MIFRSHIWLKRCFISILTSFWNTKDKLLPECVFLSLLLLHIYAFQPLTKQFKFGIHKLNNIWAQRKKHICYKRKLTTWKFRRLLFITTTKTKFAVTQKKKKTYSVWANKGHSPDIIIITDSIHSILPCKKCIITDERETEINSVELESLRIIVLVLVISIKNIHHTIFRWESLFNISKSLAKNINLRITYIGTVNDIENPVR